VVTRRGALGRLAALMTMPHAIPMDVGAATVDETRNVYENLVWAFAPMLDSVQPGEMMRVEPFVETQRRLAILAEELGDG
jgi:hypothetical protein